LVKGVVVFSKVARVARCYQILETRVTAARHWDDVVKAVVKGAKRAMGMLVAFVNYEFCRP
jgi:hypothetical protein